MKKIMLIDGNSIANRAFYGVRPLTAPDGTPTNAIYGFFAILGRLLDEEKPDGLCVTFDRREPTFRHKAYEGYKATRHGMPEELHVQMGVLKETLDAMGIHRSELSGWEADDLLGTLSLRAAKEGMEAVIVTGDKDSLQLVGDKVRVLNVKTRAGQTETIDYTPEHFKEEYGFEPPYMVDLKALMGDSSDNLPGVPGVGEKTALDLMRRFGSLNGVYENLNDPSIKEGVRKKLTAGEESARMTYFLATIDRNAPLDEELSSMAMPKEYGGKAYDMFRRLGFTRFIEKWGLKPGSEKAPAAAEVPAAAPEQAELVVLESLSQAEAFVKENEGEVFSFMADDAFRTIAVRVGNKAAVLCREGFDGFLETLQLLFGDGLKKAGHNIKDLQRRLLEQGVESRENWVFDSALAAYLLDATASEYDLATLCLAHCGYDPGSASVKEEGQLSLDLDNTAPAADAERERLSALAGAVQSLEKVLPGKLRELGMEKLYNEIELPLCAVLASMEYIGVPVDREALTAFGESLVGDIDRLQRTVWALAEEEFNINSPKQLGTVLFEHMGLPGGKKTKTGWSTNADVLDKLRYEPVVRAVLEYRELTKLKSTYAEGLLKVIGDDGRIHSRFMMTVTATGRLSSAEPNLQNIPIRKEVGSALRRMFVAGPGNVMLDADYSQIELRLLAHISDDAAMRNAFISGEDVHRVTASQVFDIPLEQVTAKDRSRAKAVNFGIVYGISAFSLSQDIGVSVNEAKAYMNAYLNRFSGVREYQKNVVEQAKADGYVSTVFGRRRALPELKNTNFNLRSFGERVAMNMPIQGTAADVIKLAMVNVDRRLRREGLQARLILQVHDELIVECPAEEADRASAILKEEMENAVSFSVPLTAEAGRGQNWAEAH